MIIEKVINSKKIVFQSYDSILEFVDFLDQNYQKEFDKKASNQKDYYFTLTNDYNEADQLLKKGYIDKDTFKEKHFDFEINYNKEKIELIKDKNGAFLDIQSFINGDPDCFFDFQNQKNYTFLKLNLTIGYSGWINAAKAKKFFLSFFNLIDEIEKQKIKIELNIFDITEFDCGTFSIIKINVKKANERLNYNQMCYPLTHPSFFRRHLFRHQEILFFKKHINNLGNYGQAKDLQTFNVLFKGNEFYNEFIEGLTTKKIKSDSDKELSEQFNDFKNQVFEKLKKGAE